MKFQILIIGVVATCFAGCTNEVHVNSVSAQTVSAPATPVASEPASQPVAEPASPPAAEPAAPAETPVEVPAAAAPQIDDSPKPPAVQRPRLDRRPRRPGEAEKITWDDLNLGMPPDVAFRPFMLSDRVKELEGQRVSIEGFMHGAPLSIKNAKEFVFLKNTQCKFGPGGQADHLARVYLREGTTTEFQSASFTVEGKLTFETYTGRPDDPTTWAIYRLDDAVVR